MSANQKPNIFMSYSRREVSFSNNLVEDLENNECTVWLDYRSLIPGTPWAEQIEKGIVESEVILLVVSVKSTKGRVVRLAITKERTADRSAAMTVILRMVLLS